jgi:hypothetical protein
MSTHPYRRLALAITLGALLVLGAIAPAGAKAPQDKPPAFLLDSQATWFTHDSGYPVVLGPADVILGNRTVGGDVAANIHPDDLSMPAPGECETAIAFVFVDGPRSADAFLSSAGEVCGLYLDEPNVVTHAFVGTATIEESGTRKLEGQEAFLEIRLAVDGRASVFATTW